jgi:hypothetical protein
LLFNCKLYGGSAKIRSKVSLGILFNILRLSPLIILKIKLSMEIALKY